MGFEGLKNKPKTPEDEQLADDFRKREVEKTLGAAKPIVMAYSRGDLSRDMVEDLFSKLLDEMDKNVDRLKK